MCRVAGRDWQRIKNSRCTARNTHTREHHLLRGEVRQRGERVELHRPATVRRWTDSTQCAAEGESRQRGRRPVLSRGGICLLMLAPRRLYQPTSSLAVAAALNTSSVSVGRVAKGRTSSEMSIEKGKQDSGEREAPSDHRTRPSQRGGAGGGYGRSGADTGERDTALACCVGCLGVRRLTSQTTTIPDLVPQLPAWCFVRGVKNRLGPEPLS